MESSPTSAPLGHYCSLTVATWAAARAGREGRMSAGLLAGTGDQHHMSTENGHCSEWARTNCVRDLSILPEWPSSYGLVTQEVLHTPAV